MLTMTLWLAGCDRTPNLESFVALPEDFEGFEQWASFEPSPQTPGHGEIPRVVYANDYALSDPTQFVIGSAIVKVATLPEGPVAHAMARRGDDYNVLGAVGWEWLELDNLDAPVPRIAWRGLEPPEGEEYALFSGADTGEDAVGDCNTCHLSAFGNQYVFSIPLE
jgi:hypothetical protein